MLKIDGVNKLKNLSQYNQDSCDNVTNRIFLFIFKLNTINNYLYISKKDVYL